MSPERRKRLSPISKKDENMAADVRHPVLPRKFRRPPRVSQVERKRETFIRRRRPRNLQKVEGLPELLAVPMVGVMFVINSMVGQAGSPRLDIIGEQVRHIKALNTV
ncbi:hypothetical protein B0O99DRAFT_603376 [Bisporella sp. PMI_857]|nr:hypothetical protein B0O99DRAFT_603376 [Bisporella sp. PMI_857]